MILSSYDRFEIGQRVDGWIQSPRNEWVQQPFIVIREATKEEAEAYGEMYAPELKDEINESDCPYHYEVLID